MIAQSLAEPTPRRRKATWRGDNPARGHPRRDGSGRPSSQGMPPPGMASPPHLIPKSYRICLHLSPQPLDVRPPAPLTAVAIVHFFRDRTDGTCQTTWNLLITIQGGSPTPSLTRGGWAYWHGVSVLIAFATGLLGPQMNFDPAWTISAAARWGRIPGSFASAAAHRHHQLLHRAKRTPPGDVLHTPAVPPSGGCGVAVIPRWSACRRANHHPNTPRSSSVGAIWLAIVARCSFLAPDRASASIWRLGNCLCLFIRLHRDVTRQTMSLLVSFGSKSY